MSSLKNFFVAFSMILKSPQLRAWYLRTMLRTFAVAILIFVLLLFGGFYFFWSMVGHWWGGLGSIIYVILLLYVSGSVTSLIASAVVQTVGGEKALLRALSEPNRREVENPSFALVFEHRKQEYFGITLSLLASVLVFPLLVFPLFLPLGLFVVAWALGQENHKTADRILLQNRERTTITGNKYLGFSAHVGLGLVPAVASIFPFVGWMSLPVLQLAAIIDVREVTQSSRV